MGKIKNSKRDFFKSLRDLFFTYFLSQLLLTKQTNAKFIQPPVQLSSSGVAYVKADDILMSEVGREEIEKVAKLAIAHKLRESLSTQQQEDN